MNLFATLETSRGKVVSISDNEQITATVYDHNMKAYSVIIEFTDIGDIIDDEGNALPDGQRTRGAIVTTREWRNTDDRKGKCTTKGCTNNDQPDDPKCPAHADLANLGIY